MPPFTRFIGIDWSGAGGDDDRCGLRVAAARLGEELTSLRPPTSGRAKNWKRSEIQSFLRQELTEDADKTLVGIDAALSYPIGSAEAVFGVHSWRQTVREIAAISKKTDSLGEFFALVNERHADKSGVPFFSRSKDKTQKSWWRDHHTSHGFFTDTGVSYYRLIDTFIPGAISTFYIGPGPMVAGHTVTCLSTLSPLLDDRDDRETGENLDFAIWHYEPNWRNRKHLIAECYPAILPEHDRSTEITNRDELDARKIASWLQNMPPEKLDNLLDIDAATNQQLHPILAEEGWVLGVHAPATTPKLIQNWTKDSQ